MKETQPKPQTEPKIEIKTMPTKEQLEAFMRGMHGEPKVIFDSEKGEFVQIRK